MNEPTLARVRTGVARDVGFADRRHGSVRRKKSWHATVKPADARTEQLLGEYEARLHEVRGSLAAVAAAVHALTMSEVDASEGQQPQIARMLGDEVERLKRLVAPENLPHVQPVEELDLDEVIESVVALRRLTGHRVEWRPSGHRIAGRRDEFVEVLNILLVNAARHAPGAPVAVEVREDDGVIRVCVSDEGPGVREELRRGIFDRGTCDPVTGGTGVGLSVARSLVHGLGGSLDLKDGVVGAKFELTLPAPALGGVA
ncbi:MAG: HAMP domain-containing sensor histidine kinase [Nocardioides sp.]